MGAARLVVPGTSAERRGGAGVGRTHIRPYQPPRFHKPTHKDKMEDSRIEQAVGDGDEKGWEDIV